MTSELEDYPENYPEKGSPAKGCLVGLGVSTFVWALGILLMVVLCRLM